MTMKTMRWLALAALVAACEEPLNTNPTDAIDSGDALTTARGVELAVIGAYSALQTNALYSRELTVYPEMYADNLDFTGTYGTDFQVSLRDILATNTAIEAAWADSYDAINRANNVLKAIPEVSDLTSEQAARFKGEALFLRALNYFNLVRYFGGVPIVLEPSVGIGEEALVARNTREEVYDRIITDLTDAIPLLPESGSPGRATKGGARALLAKAYLEIGEWENARDMATAVINGDYELVANYRSIFTTKSNSESIFEVQYSINDPNSLAFWYFPQSLGGRRGFAPSEDLYNAYEAGDVRRDASIALDGSGDRYGIKYFRVANGDDNILVIRLADMYLTRAEANARLHADPATVRADIDIIRDRAGLGPLPTTVTSEDDLIEAILKERRVEFAMEGHRFFDLRRTGRAEAVLGIPSTRLLFPIPQGEIDVNSNLTQNPGY